MDTDARLLALDGKYKDRRGFVIGGGPSIKSYSKETINHLSKEITVGANHAFLLFTPTLLCFTDKGYYRDYHKELKELKCPVLCPDNLAAFGRNIRRFRTGKQKQDSLAPKSFYDKIPFWNNTGATALRIVYILGCNPIYLIGVDLFKPDKERNLTHFHDAYNQKRRSGTKTKRFDAFTECFTKTIAAMSDRKIYSCSPKCEVLNDKVIPFAALEDVLDEKE